MDERVAEVLKWLERRGSRRNVEGKDALRQLASPAARARLARRSR